MKKILLVIILLIALVFAVGKFAPEHTDRDNLSKFLKYTSRGLMAYRNDCLKFPTTSEGLKKIINDGECEGFKFTKYINEIPENSQGVPFVYLSDGNSFTLYTILEKNQEKEIHLQINELGNIETREISIEDQNK